MRYEYYERMKALAREIRAKYEIVATRVTRRDIRRVYRAEGVRIDLRPGFKKLRGAYFNDECGPTVVIARGLPEDPAAFTMAHELKHHLVDRDNPDFQCSFSLDTKAMIEIGAEVFAAEFLFPESEFVRLLGDNGVTPGACTPEHLVRLKHETRTTLSYQGLAKRAEFLGLAPPNAFRGVQFKTLEEQMYGKPFRRPSKKALVVPK